MTRRTAWGIGQVSLCGSWVMMVVGFYECFLQHLEVEHFLQFNLKVSAQTPGRLVNVLWWFGGSFIGLENFA